MNQIKFNLIAAACENMGIGINGILPWKLKNELKHFSRVTKKINDEKKQNVIIMGRKTYFGIPEEHRPLDNRINIVLSKNTNTNDYPENVILCNSLENAIERIRESDLKDKVENIWVVGGTSVFKEAMESESCHRIYFTDIKASFECDTFFPTITDDFKQVNNDEDIPDTIQVENGVKYQYKIYEKIKL